MRFRTASVLTAALAMAWPSLAPSATAPAAAATVPTKLVETQSAMRDLWLGHIFWVRNVVEARLANNASAAKAAVSCPGSSTASSQTKSRAMVFA